MEEKSEISDKLHKMENNNNTDEKLWTITDRSDDLKKDDLKANNEPRKDKYFLQFLAAWSASMLLASGASAFGWASPALPMLLADDSPLPITEDESSWIVAIMVVGTVVAPIPTAWLMDNFGRKRTLLLAALPLLIGWTLIGIAQSVVVLYVSRFFSGVGYGIIYSVLPMYLAEISSDKIRGTMTALLTVMAKVGILFTFSIAPYVEFHVMGWIGFVPLVIFLASFIWMPDSPYFLIDKQKATAALKTLKRLRGHDDVQSELDRMTEAVTLSKQNKGTYREIFAPNNRKSFIILIGLASIQQLCGSQAIISYSTIIFERVGSDLGASEASIVLAVVQLASAIVSTSIVDILGRKLLLMISVVGSAINCSIVAIYFTLERYEYDVNGISWLPMAAIMIYIVCYTIGMAVVTFVVISEVFPKNLRAVAGAVFTITSSLVSFAIAKLFQTVSTNLGIDITFWGFAVFSYIFIPFIWFVIPETKGKSFEVILAELKSKKI